MDTVFGRVKVKRGTLAGMPTLAAGEPYFTEDTHDLWIGSTLGNVKASRDDATAAALAAHIADTTSAHAASAISFAGNVTFSSTTVQDALTDLDTRKADVDFVRRLTLLDL